MIEPVLRGGQQQLGGKDVNLQEELKPLWVACYFDRRLSKSQVQALDLRHTMLVIRELMSNEEFGSDFRKVYPFVFGFIKIMLRKFNILISESSCTLDSLKNPFADEEVEEIGELLKKRVRGGEPRKDGAYQAGALKNKRPFIDVANIKFPGIDKQVLLRLEEAIKRDVTELREPAMKRDEDGGAMYLTGFNDEHGNDMRNGFLSAIKHEGGLEPENDLRKQVDVQGNFLNDISFGLPSPIVPKRTENRFEQNVNLTMEMQKLVNEHLRMEEYPPEDDAPNFDMPMEFAEPPHVVGF
jgi:hypothetical protein